MIIVNMLLIILIIVVVWLLYKFYFMRKQISDELNKHSAVKPESKNNIQNKIEKFQNENKNIFFKIKVGHEIHKIEIKLFENKVPLTVKNFRILCTRGVGGKTYKDSIFHRIIKNFMIQGGDIINSDGTGSISIYGEQFEDEGFHFSHDRKGLLSMANSGPDTNGSQFFITTAPCTHLDGKHVIFGEVVEGLDVLDKIENLSTDQNDKPYQPVTIIECGEI